MISHRNAARMFGIFFIFTFISYGVGSGLVDSITGEPDFLANIYANQTTIIIGVILMALVHTFLNIGLPVILMPILRPFNKNVAYGYLSAAIVATVVLVVGGIYMLLLIPLSDEFTKAGSTALTYFETIGILLKMGGAFSYQLGMALWGLGGMMLVSLLYRTKLVPRYLAGWGIIGYIVFISGTILELFGIGAGVFLALPGGLFEIGLSVWLIARGFNTEVIASVSPEC